MKRFVVPGVLLVCAAVLAYRIQMGDDPIVRQGIVVVVPAGNVGVPGDQRLSAYLIGDAPVERDAALDAMCVNDDLFARDVTLGTTIAVGSSSRLIRVAELIGEGRFEADFARQVEAEVLEAGSTDETSIADAAGLETSRVRSYLDAADESPSEDARRRYVVFAGRVTLWEVELFFVDRDSVDWPNLTLDRGAGYETYVPSGDGWRDLEVGPDQCVRRSSVPPYGIRIVPPGSVGQRGGWRLFQIGRGGVDCSPPE